MTLIDAIRSAWGWTGITPVDVVAENAFGNLIVKDVSGQYWRLCPEDLYCQVIAASIDELERLWTDDDFQLDWQMTALVDRARSQLGELHQGRKYCLKIAGVLGGEYGGDNLGEIALIELIGSSGDIARQIADLPDGTQVSFSIT